MSYLFEQAGVQKKLTEAGLWFATAPKDEFEKLVEQEPGILRDWDETYVPQWMPALRHFAVRWDLPALRSVHGFILPLESAALCST